MITFGFIGTSGSIVPLDPRDELGDPVDDVTAFDLAREFATTSELPIVVQGDSGEWHSLCEAA